MDLQFIKLVGILELLSNNHPYKKNLFNSFI